MNENTTEQGGQERRVGPTVSRDKWLVHARLKLAKGYQLIIAKDGKKRANFWHREKGFEMCAYDVARALVASGEVIPVGEHPLGLLYGPGTPPEPPPKPARKHKPKPAVARVAVVAAAKPEAAFEEVAAGHARAPETPAP